MIIFSLAYFTDFHAVHSLTHTIVQTYTGRYRSTAHLVADIRYVLEGVILKKQLLRQAAAAFAHDSEREKLAELHSLIVALLEGEFAANILL